MSLRNLDSFVFDNITFGGNRAILGGAMYISVLVVNGNITNCHFNKNIAHKGNGTQGSGGAIYLQQYSLETISSRLLLATLYEQVQDLLIKNCAFAENIAYIGGAIYTKQLEFILSNDTFQNNQATNGGALVTEITNTPSKNYTIVISRCHFVSNNANQHGASILQLRDDVISIDNDTEMVDASQKYNTGAPGKIRLNAYRYTGEESTYGSKRNMTTLLANGDLTLVYNSSAANTTLVMTNISSGGYFNLLLEFGVYDSKNFLLRELGPDDGK